MIPSGIDYIFRNFIPNRERLTKLAEWVDENNNILVNIEKFFLEEVGDALDYQKNVLPRGKVVLVI